jgi:hypothetical protein
MDARQMKKHILATALHDHLSYFEAVGLDSAFYAVAMSLDLNDQDNVSLAQYKRYIRVLKNMLDSAESKI